MSIATLKRKTQTKYNNMSVSQPQFSLNGGYRNQGYIGQSTQSRFTSRTLMVGTAIRGHGGGCGRYIFTKSRAGMCGRFPILPIVTSSVYSTENNRVIKRSVLDNDGRIATRYRWIRRPQPDATVKPDVNQGLNIQSNYVNYKKNLAINATSTVARNNLCGPRAEPAIDRTVCRANPLMFRSRLNTPQSFNRTNCTLANKINRSNLFKNNILQQSDYIERKSNGCVQANDQKFLRFRRMTTGFLTRC
jgi:hypothetical protein